MPDVRESMDIAAKPQEVWDLVMDPERLGDWVTAHREVSDVPELPLKAGDSFKQKLQVKGPSFSAEWELIEVDAPHLAVWKASGPMGTGADVRYELTAENGGTRFDYVNDFTLPGGPLKKAASRISGAPAKRAARDSLEKLKALFES